MGHITLGPQQQACGFCGGVVSDVQCLPQLTTGSRKTVTKVLANNCPCHVDVNCTSAVKVSNTSPCTNMPCNCSLCDQDVHAWKYHMLDHIEQQHHQVTEQQLRMFAISQAEL